MATNGTQIGNLLFVGLLTPSKLFPRGETSQLFLYLVGTKPSGISNFCVITPVLDCII